MLLGKWHHRLTQCGIAINLQFVKHSISTKYNKLKHNKARCLYKLFFATKIALGVAAFADTGLMFSPLDKLKPRWVCSGLGSPAALRRVFFGSQGPPMTTPFLLCGPFSFLHPKRLYLGALLALRSLCGLVTCLPGEPGGGQSSRT